MRGLVLAVLLSIGTVASPAQAAPQSRCVADPGEVAGRAAAPEPAFAEPPPELVSKLDASVQSSLKAAAAPGAIVGVRTPQGTWTMAYGFADPDTREEMTTGMHVRIGSVTKTFVGTALLQLAQEGKLSLDDPIDKYYRDIPNGDRITLAHLANMTSGIAGYYTDAFLDRYFADPTGTFSPDELIRNGASASPLFEPGEMFNYSNTNTILLGKVIEAVTAKPVEQVLRERIFEPLALTGTSMPAGSLEIPQPHPQGYTMQGTRTVARDSDQPQNATGWSPPVGWTANAMISNLEDLLTFTRALGTGEGLLAKQTQIKRLESIRTPTGYGLALVCFGGWVGHTGEIPGFNTTAYYDTTTDTSVVVLVNSDIGQAGCPEPLSLADGPTGQPCSSSATKIFMELAESLGHPFPLPAR